MTVLWFQSKGSHRQVIIKHLNVRTLSSFLYTRKFVISTGLIQSVIKYVQRKEDLWYGYFLFWTNSYRTLLYVFLSVSNGRQLPRWLSHHITLFLIYIEQIAQKVKYFSTVKINFHFICELKIWCVWRHYSPTFKCQMWCHIDVIEFKIT